VSAFNAGEKCIALRDLGGIFTHSVSKGTEGTVVDRSGWAVTRYTIRFDNGEMISNLPEADLARVEVVV
jgi:hypothetical protein